MGRERNSSLPEEEASLLMRHLQLRVKEEGWHLAVGGDRQGGLLQVEEVACVVGEGVRAWHAPGQQRALVICRSCSDAD